MPTIGRLSDCPSDAPQVRRAYATAPRRPGTPRGCSRSRLQRNSPHHDAVSSGLERLRARACVRRRRVWCMHIRHGLRAPRELRARPLLGHLACVLPELSGLRFRIRLHAERAITRPEGQRRASVILLVRRRCEPVRRGNHYRVKLQGHSEMSTFREELQRLWATPLVVMMLASCGESTSDTTGEGSGGTAGGGGVDSAVDASAYELCDGSPDLRFGCEAGGRRHIRACSPPNKPPRCRAGGCLRHHAPFGALQAVPVSLHPLGGTSSGGVDRGGADRAGVLSFKT